MNKREFIANYIDENRGSGYSLMAIIEEAEAEWKIHEAAIKEQESELSFENYDLMR